MRIILLGFIIVQINDDNSNKMHSFLRSFLYANRLYSAANCVQIDDILGKRFTALYGYSPNGTTMMQAQFLPKNDQVDCSKYNGILNATNGSSVPLQEFYDTFATMVEPYSTCSVQRDLCGELNKFDPTKSSTFTYMSVGSIVKEFKNITSPPSISLSDIAGATCNLDGSLADEEENNTTSNANLIPHYHTYHNCVTTMMISMILVSMPIIILFH
jgi:hypothetical protein